MSQTEPDIVSKVFQDAKAKGTKLPERTPMKGLKEPSHPPKKRAHSSYYVDRMLHQQAFKLVAPGLQRAKQGEGMILIALVMLSGIPAGFGAIYFYEQAHPPLHLVGVCPVNATLTANDCYTVQTVVINQQTTTVHVPAGYLVFPNGTNYRGGG